MQYRIGDVEIDLDRFEVRREGSVVQVEPQVFDLLAYLAGNPDRVLTKEELLDAIWGDRFVSESALASRVKAARRAVGDDGRKQAVIATVHGRGYRLVAPVEAGAEPASAPLPVGPVLERDGALDTLSQALERAGARAGSVVCLRGEAGIGKTTVLRSFAAGVQLPARVVVGVCADLLTPSALAPVNEVLDQLGEASAAGAASDAVDRIVAAATQPLVVALEDVHWADDATLDTIRLLARRLTTLPLVLVITYRGDDLDPGHPLLELVGALHKSSLVPVDLAPLSAAAVGQLAGDAGRDADDLLAATGGNPLLVTEVLRTGGESVPPTVRDLVAARLASLPEATRGAVELLAVSPVPVGVELAAELAGRSLATLVMAERRGLVSTRGDAIAFRHELVRLAVANAQPALLRIDNHRRIHDALIARADDAARVVHHAVGAGAVDSILRYGPVAARQAARAEAHRQAAELFGLVLDHADRLEPGAEAVLRHELALQLFLLDRPAEAEEEVGRAIDLALQTGDHVTVGDAQITLTRILAWVGRLEEAVEVAQAAVASLQSEPDTAVLGRAYAELAGRLVNVERNEEAVVAAERAAAIATQLGDRGIETLALNYKGNALMEMGVAEGESFLRAAIALAEETGNREYASRTGANLAVSLWSTGRWLASAEAVERAWANAEGGEFATGVLNLATMRCHTLLSAGRYAECARQAEQLLATGTRPQLGIELAVLRARVELRQGVPSGEVALRAEWATGEHDPRVDPLSRYQSVLVMAALAELAWMADDAELALEVQEAWDSSTWGRTYHTEVGELALYMQLRGTPFASGDVQLVPFALALAGDWADAAAAFAESGRPHEQALCLAEAGDIDAAAEILDRLGASAVTARLRSS